MIQLFQVLQPQNIDSGHETPQFRGEVIGPLGGAHCALLTLIQTLLQEKKKIEMCINRKSHHPHSMKQIHTEFSYFISQVILYDQYLMLA